MSRTNESYASESWLNRLIRDRRGAGLTEYIILVGVIALLAIGAFRFFGKSVSKKIEQQAGTVTNIEVGE
jgi:Flp pilus assembly pilin Flp